MNFHAITSISINRYLFIENRETHEYKYSISDLDIQPHVNRQMRLPLNPNYIENNHK